MVTQRARVGSAFGVAFARYQVRRRRLGRLCPRHVTIKTQTTKEKSGAEHELEARSGGGAQIDALQKPSEKLFMFFSCAKKAHIPEGTVTIQAEVKTVGFTDEAGRESELDCSDPDLTPDQRPKVDLKSKPKK